MGLILDTGVLIRGEKRSAERGGLARNVTLGAHDLIIGATALAHGFALLTANVADFRRMPGVVVVPFE